MNPACSSRFHVPKRVFVKACRKNEFVLLMDFETSLEAKGLRLVKKRAWTVHVTNFVANYDSKQ